MEKREHLNREVGMTGRMSIEFDIETGKIRCDASGFWSVRQARDFFVDWKDIVFRIHRVGRPISGLVDMSTSGVQKPDVAAVIANATTGLYVAGDAIAMLVPNSLAKIQMRRVLDARFHEFFISPEAARTWLAARSLRQGVTERATA